MFFDWQKYQLQSTPPYRATSYIPVFCHNCRVHRLTVPSTSSTFIEHHCCIPPLHCLQHITLSCRPRSTSRSPPTPLHQSATRLTQHRLIPSHPKLTRIPLCPPVPRCQTNLPSTSSAPRPPSSATHHSLCSPTQTSYMPATTSTSDPA